MSWCSFLLVIIGSTALGSVLILFILAGFDKLGSAALQAAVAKDRHGMFCTYAVIPGTYTA